MENYEEKRRLRANYTIVNHHRLSSQISTKYERKTKFKITNCYNMLPKFSILCDNNASNVCKLYDSASIPLASVFRKCISYSSSKRDVGEPGVGVTFG